LLRNFATEPGQAYIEV